MKIERVVPHLIGRCLIVRVYTDQGIVGTGEAGLWAHHEVVYKAIEQFAEYYVGKDPTRMEHHYQVLTRDSHFMGSVMSAALSAMDIAQWDILARSVDRPIHQLLGGKCRDKVRVFANVSGNTVEERAASAREQVDKGFESLRTIPMLPGFEKQSNTRVVKDAVRIVAAIRDEVGDEVDLGLEIHRNLEPEAAIMLANELLPYRLLYYEDPLRPQSIEAIEYVARHVNIPIATGERFHSIYQFKDLIDRKIVSLIRPDLSLAGGYTQCKKIAALAEAGFVGVFPHLMGSPVNIAAYVQFDASIPNYVLMEAHNADAHPLNEILEQPLTLKDGYILVPDGPGIGVNVREEKLAEFPFEPKPAKGFFKADGSVSH